MKIHMLWGDVFGEFILFIYHELTTAKFSVKKLNRNLSRKIKIFPAIRKLLFTIIICRRRLMLRPRRPARPHTISYANREPALIAHFFIST